MQVEGGAEGSGVKLPAVSAGGKDGCGLCTGMARQRPWATRRTVNTAAATGSSEQRSVISLREAYWN